MYGISIVCPIAIQINSSLTKKQIFQFYSQFKKNKAKDECIVAWDMLPIRER